MNETTIEPFREKIFCAAENVSSNTNETTIEPLSEKTGESQRAFFGHFTCSLGRHRGSRSHVEMLHEQQLISIRF